MVWKRIAYTNVFLEDEIHKCVASSSTAWNPFSGVDDKHKIVILQVRKNTEEQRTQKMRKHEVV